MCFQYNDWHYLFYMVQYHNQLVLYFLHVPLAAHVASAHHGLHDPRVETHILSNIYTHHTASMAGISSRSHVIMSTKFNKYPEKMIQFFEYRCIEHVLGYVIKNIQPPKVHRKNKVVIHCKSLSHCHLQCDNINLPKTDKNDLSNTWMHMLLYANSINFHMLIRLNYEWEY